MKINKCFFLLTVGALLCAEYVGATPAKTAPTQTYKARGGFTPAYTPEKSIDLSIPETYYLVYGETDATVTVGGDPGPSGVFNVSVTGPGTVTPNAFQVNPGIAKTIHIVFTSAAGKETYRASIDGTNPVIKDDETVEVVEPTIVSNYDTAAEGAKGTTEHQTTLTMTLRDSHSNPVSGLAIPAPVISSGGRGPRDGTVTATVEVPNNVTDSQGIVVGTFQSGNRDEQTKVTIPLKTDIDAQGNPSYTGPDVTITQVWNDLPDGNGEGLQWNYDPFFEYDTDSNVTFKISVQRAILEPVRSHSLEFTTIKLITRVWDPNSGPDEDGDNVPDGLYVPRTFESGQPGFNSPVITGSATTPSSLVKWNPVVATSADGRYLTKMKVRSSRDCIVDSVEFYVYDNDAFGPAGDERPLPN